MEEIDYKKLWFELCDEKVKLQRENNMLKKNYEYISKKFESLERIHNQLIQKDWNKSK